MLLDSFGFIKIFNAFHYTALVIFQKHWTTLNIIFSPETTTFILWIDFWLVCDNLFFTPLGLQDTMKDTYKLQFVFFYFLVFKICNWYRGAGMGSVGCFLTCFSVFENVSSVVLSRTGNFRIDVSYMHNLFCCLRPRDMWEIREARLYCSVVL